MTTSLMEHRVALAMLSGESYTKGEVHKVTALLGRLRHLQMLDEHDRASSSTEGERAALLWALSRLGVICGVLIRERRGANLRCVRPADHPDGCDERLGWHG